MTFVPTSKLTAKISPAFHLDPMDGPIPLAQDPKEKTWYPLNGFGMDKNELFIYGRGAVKIGKWKRAEVNPCSNPFTAKELKVVADEYGINAALGMVRGWSNYSVFHDNSYGLSSAKMELANMSTFGEAYDKFANHIQKVGDYWITALQQNGFHLQGYVSKGWLWYDYKNENEFGELIGQVGVYGKTRLHPLQHIDHSLGHGPFSFRCPPMFNPISFDKMLWDLFRGKYITDDGDYKMVDKMWNKIVSVKDRIAHLTNDSVASEIESIFEVQKEFNNA